MTSTLLRAQEATALRMLNSCSCFDRSYNRFCHDCFELRRITANCGILSSTHVSDFCKIYFKFFVSKAVLGYVYCRLVLVT